MNDLREKMRNNERNAMQNDDEIGRLKHELELEQGENGKILAQREDLSRQLDLLRAENLSQSSRISHLEKDGSSGYILPNCPETPQGPGKKSRIPGEINEKF